jgi:hypothetical protein
VVILTKAAIREEGGAIIAIQSTVLARDQIASTVFAHRRGAHGAIGLVSRHFGEEAFTNADPCQLTSTQQMDHLNSRYQKRSK